MRNGNKRGFVLLAVLAFIAFIMPVILLVLATISAETMSVGERVKGAKADRAAEQAIGNAASLLLQDRQYPNYWNSVGNQVNAGNSAIIVDDGFGNRRNNIANSGAGPDDIYGTGDDYWIGPRKDRSWLPADDTTDPRNYRYDFRFLSSDGPVYLAQRWAYNLAANPYLDLVNSAGIPIQFYNQFAAVQSDQDGDGVNEGFVPDELDQLLFPGYYPAAIPPIGPYNTDLTSGTIANSMLEYRTKLYEGIYENLDQGPVPSTLTRSYGSVADENGRLNLNIFCKKVRVWAPESSTYDTSAWTNQVTSDFNANNMPGEWGWHWMDNPLFPDRNTTLLRNASGAVTGVIDFGSVDFSTGWPVNTQDGQAWPALGETVQHYYADDWVYSAVESKRMLMALPGVNETLAENILRALNPDLSTIPDPPSVNGGTPDADNHRLDAPNLTPTLAALNVVTAGGGQITGFEWRYDWYDNDDLPLPPPRPLNDVKELLNVRGMSTAKFDRIKDLVTVYSYDTNVVQNYISDVSSTVDPVNPPGMPLGSARRQIPSSLVDRDNLPDLRYDLNKQLEDTSLTALEQEADVLYAFLANHLPDGVFDKFTLPVIDREHRGPSDHIGPAPVGGGTDGLPYNVGEYGHQYDIDLGGSVTEQGAGYPTLDPPFSRDSALSILLYRYGLTQEDAYRYSQDGGNVRRASPGIPLQGMRSFIPIVNPIILIPGLFELHFQPAHLPLQSAGTNINAVIPPHQFDSVADVLEVPLYKFSRFSVGIMADPPSDYVCQAIGRNEVTVNYYVSLSDIIQLGEYDDAGTVGNLTDDQVAYTYDIYFDYNNDNNPDDMVTLAFGDNLRLVSAPPTASRPGIITTFSQPTGQRYLQFSRRFTRADIPDPGGAPGSTSGDFAFDAFGNPFITARVMAVKAAGTPEETLADAVVKVYLQENCDTFIPIKASVLAVRVSADQFMLLSSVGGGVEDPNSFRLYNWSFNGSPQSIDGTFPAQPLGRDPRTVFLSPLNDTIRLTVYDLYSPMSGPCWPGLPVPVGTTALPPGIINANEVQPAFPAAPYPNVGRDTDTVQVEIIGGTPNVAAEVACEPPAVEQGGSVLLHIGAYGGVSPYNLNVQIFDSVGGLVQSFNYGGYQNNTLTVETDPFPTQGTYRVVLTAIDSTTPVPTSAIDITTLVVGSQGQAGKSFTNVPNMTASIDLEPLSSPSKGFTATASISGGRGEYGYFWQVFDEFGALATGNQGQRLTSNSQLFTAQFAPNQSQDGVYFVKVMVIDQKNINPNNATNTVLATDTEMVVIGSPGLTSYQPMATLAAIPPGNGKDSIADNSQIPLITGSGPQPRLSTDPGVPPIVPEVAGAGSTIQIYGYNFDPHPHHNFVTFGGGATTSPTNPPILDPSYTGPAPARQIMSVVVPADARTGWLTVKTLDGGNGGVSGRALFQTHFLVSFDAIASVIPDITHNYRMEVDFQGDGIIDARADTTRMSGSPGIISYQQMPSLQYDYANDGFGNYNATLIVTDLRNNKVAVSHQLIQIRDLRPLMDSANNTANAYGMNVSLQPMYSDRYPLPGMGLDVRSYTGGITSAYGLKYRWNVDGNGRYALLTSAPPPAQPTFWETEPNNTSATANIMPVNYDPFTDGATRTGRTSNAADVDWYRLAFPQAGCMSMLLQCFTITGTNQLRIDLFNQAMTLLDTSQIVAGGNSTFATTDRNSPAGTYYVRISGNSAQTYELEATYSPNPGNTFWEAEPNNTSATANVMPIDYDPDRDAFPFTGRVRQSTDPLDWYVLTTTATGTLNLLIQAIDTGPGEEVYATLYNAALAPISTATIRQNDWAAIVGTALDVPAGTFYVRLSNNANPWQRYQIDPSFVAQGTWVTPGPVNFSVSSSISADGRFVSPNVPVKYYANLGFNFTTTNPNVFNIQVDDRDTNGDGMPDAPVTFSWDFTGEGTPDVVHNIPVSQISTELYASHINGFAGWNYGAVGSYSRGTLRVSGNLLVTYNDNRVSTQSFTLPMPAPLPTVDVSNVLSTLSLPTLGNDTGHLIALTVYGQDYDLTTGVTNSIQASDTIYIPSGLNPMDNVAGYLATENPYLLSNTPGNTIFTLTGINGQGSDMQYWADLNTDGFFEIGGQGFYNPQTHTRVTAANGLNLLNPGAINSYPTSLPGVWFQFIDIGVNIEANRGVYTAAALVRDNPPAGTEVSYAFDSQAVFVGGNRGAGSSSPLPLAADTFIDPLAGVTTQGFSLESFVTGGASPYNYRWDIIHVDSGTPIFFSDINQHFAPNPVFVPSTDAADELAGSVSGTYRIVLTAFDSAGSFIVTRPRTITVEEAPLNAQLMAMPPAVAVNERVRFVVYIDGGRPPYNITINYNDPDAPGLTASVTTSGRYTPFEHAYTRVWMDRSSPANGRYDDPEDGVNPTINVIDANGDIINSVTSPSNATQKVLVGERLPLNITSLVSPSSGWNNFRVAVNYAIAGGRKFGGSSLGNLVTSGPASNLAGLFNQSSDYFVTIALISSEGSLVDMQFRDTRTTIINPYGADGVMMNGDVGEVYDPVYLYVPYAGNYYVIVTATDGSGEFAISQQQVYAAGYLTPQSYGDTTPKVRRDRDGRPLHAARIWVDPLYRPYSDTNEYRLREADVQVFGDLLTVDPNPSFLSPGFMAAKDPAAVPMFDLSYLSDPQTNTPVDFYDTYTMGRVNINTASEEVLAALFSKIIKHRAYFMEDGTTYNRGDRDYENDEYITRSEANALARAVVEYRNAYYDAYKPETSNTPGGYEYTHGAGIDPYASGDIRVDHLPVIGPWDGVNPRSDDYPDPGQRDDIWPDQGDNNVRNSWDNFRGIYYNLDRGDSRLQFYATSDIAVVRGRFSTESAESYAKYLNDTLDNSTTLDSLDPMAVDERRGFDSRQYFTYDAEAGETRADARDRIALLYSGGETAFTFIPNPPFQSLFDLFKVIGVMNDAMYADLMEDEPRTFNVEDTNGDGNRDNVEVDGNGFSTQFRTPSGPSLFRYAEIWDSLNNEYKVIANYLDDIAPYVTTRSYTFRVTGIGGVSVSGGASATPVAADQISRDRVIEQVLDLGKMRTQRRDPTAVNSSTSSRNAYEVVYSDSFAGGGT